MAAGIEIVAWTARWADDFAGLKPGILAAAPAGAVLNHIGSTAVAGLAAKDIIDLQLSVDDLSDIDIAAIEAAGFLHRPGLADHCPSGLELHERELQKLFFRSTGRPAHLHVRQKGRFNQRYALLFRDYLRSHPVAAQSYAAIKQHLSERFADDTEAYYDIKDPVCDLIMEAANLWATASGWVVPGAD